MLKETKKGLESTTDRYPPITRQTHYPLGHAASLNVYFIGISMRVLIFLYNIYVCITHRIYTHLM